MRVLLVSIFILVGVCLLFLVLLFLAQRSLLYYRTRMYIGPAEAQANGAFREIQVRTQDGIDLKGWYAPAIRRPFTIVFFHGNADSLRSAARIADPYIEAGYGFLIAEYRGYSGLPGAPTEAGLYDDARAYLLDLMARGIESKRVILFGQSLGSGVAVQMASEFHAGGVMLLTPFLSIPKAALSHFPFFPAGFVILDRFENEKKIANIHSPLLIVSSSRDEVVPASHGEKLYSQAKEPKEFHELEGRGHNDALDEFIPLSLDWIGRVCGEG